MGIVGPYCRQCEYDPDDKVKVPRSMKATRLLLRLCVATVAVLCVLGLVFSHRIDYCTPCGKIR